MKTSKYFKNRSLPERNRYQNYFKNLVNKTLPKL